jgi:hypothetical protein
MKQIRNHTEISENISRYISRPYTCETYKVVQEIKPQYKERGIEGERERKKG